MRDFKLLRGIDEESLEPLHENSPSWMWVEEYVLTPVPHHRWILMTDNCFGIRSFLNQFPDNFIIPVDSITGNGIRHSFGNRNNGNGWGFDITSELITVEYYVLIPDIGQ